MRTEEEAATDIHRRLSDLEYNYKETNKILVSLNLTIERISHNITALQEFKSDLVKYDIRLNKCEKWMSENKRSVESIESEKEKVNSLRDEILVNRPVIRAILIVMTTLTTSAIGLILTYIFAK